MQKLSQAVRAAVLSGSVASLVSCAALVVCSSRDQGRAAAALNGPSQWLWGRRALRAKRASLRYTALGYAIHHASSIFWATLHEWAFGEAHRSARRSIPLACAQAAATTAAAYIVDYYVTPQRLRPGFEKHLDPRSLFAVYAAFGAGLALATIARRHAQRSRRRPPSQLRASLRARGRQ
jgi:hypothetical protein